MNRKTSQKFLIVSLETSAIMLAIFGLLLYHGIFSYAATLKVASPDRHLSLAATVPVIVPSETIVTSGIVNAVETITRPVTTSPKPIKASPRLIIPSIGVNALIEQVALTAEGSMGVPTNPMNAGWYSPGPMPGEPGSAVIDGHVNWFNGATGVFRDLHSLKVGDKISTQNAEGEISIFIVKNIKTFDPAADATTIFSSNDGKAHLNLITCGGTWDKQTKQYTERLVVFTDKE